MSVSGQAGENSDLSSVSGNATQAQALPPISPLLLTSCETAGYYYDDMVPYSFEDISATGTALNMTDDVEVDIPIGFTFNYYCGAYTTVTVSDNGVLSFDSPSANIPYGNSCLPSSSANYTTLIAPFWDDLDPTPADADVFYEVKGTAPNRRLIVQWNNISFWSSSAGRVTFQAILFEGIDKILFQYADVTFGTGADGGASATIGIQKDDTTALQYSCDTASLTAGLAILFTPYAEMTSPSLSTIGLDYDCHRNGVWIATEGGNIYLVNSVTYVVEKTINLVGKVMAADGNSDGLAVLDNGNLLLADYQGDGAVNIDDYLFEFNPDTETMVNYWPLDGTFNTSTDSTNINEVIDVEMSFEPFRRAYVTSASDQNLYEVQLTPGKPGTWKTLAVHPLGSLTGASTGVDKVACYEDTPLTGFAVSDWGATAINFYDPSLALLSNFGAGHIGNIFNTGVTVVPGNPAKLWVTDYITNTIGIFDTGQKCTMHCGKFPWHEIIGAISQGASAP
jgi:hypothetical protein